MSSQNKNNYVSLILANRKKKKLEHILKGIENFFIASQNSSKQDKCPTIKHKKKKKYFITNKEKVAEYWKNTFKRNWNIWLTFWAHWELRTFCRGKLK